MSCRIWVISLSSINLPVSYLILFLLSSLAMHYCANRPHFDHSFFSWWTPPPEIPQNLAESLLLFCEVGTILNQLVLTSLCSQTDGSLHLHQRNFCLQRLGIHREAENECLRMLSPNWNMDTTPSFRDSEVFVQEGEMMDDKNKRSGLRTWDSSTSELTVAVTRRTILVKL